MPSEWNLHYFRWMIGDGEPERHVDDVFDWFAISFWSDAGLIWSADKSKTAVSVGDNAYRVNAELYTFPENLRRRPVFLTSA